MPLIAELKRRNVLRMAGLYLVASWLIVQVSSTILPMFAAPDWMPRSVVVLLAIGFGLAKLVSLPFGGISTAGGFFLGLVIILLILGVMALLGRRRQKAAQAKARAARDGG